MMLNLTWAGKFGSLSNYCCVPAMPMEPPTKKRRYLKGMELAEADREQSPRTHQSLLGGGHFPLNSAGKKSEAFHASSL